MSLLQYLLTLAFLVLCAGSGLLRPVPITTLVVRGLIVVSTFSFVAFFCSLAHLRWAVVTVSASALIVGAFGWFVAIARSVRARPVPTSVLHGATLGSVAVSLAVFPLLAFYSSARMQEPFEAIQDQLKLPIDNILPTLLARASAADAYPRPMIGDWLGSDRPPLQSGFILLADPLLGPLMGADRSAFLVSVAAQAVWLPGAALLVYAVFKRSDVIAAGLTTLALTGAALLNSIFTWPKLLAAGLLMACGAVSLDALRRQQGSSPRPWMPWVTAGALAGLASLAHGVSMFALAALCLVLVFFSRSPGVWGRFKPPIFLLVTAFALQLPWMAWQRWGDPPGDRLLKYHLAGVTQPDSRSFLRTLIDSYRDLGWSGTLDYKLSNLRNILAVDATPISPLMALGHPDAARASDFYSVFAAISWAVPVLATTTALLLFRRRSILSERDRWAVACVLVWVAITAFIWALLMFGPATTINHQGPLTLSLVPLAVAAAWARGHGPRPWLIGTAAQGVCFFWIYILAPDMAWYQTPLWAAIVATQCLVTAIVLSAFPLSVLASPRSPPVPSTPEQNPTEPASPVATAQTPGATGYHPDESPHLTEAEGGASS